MVADDRHRGIGVIFGMEAPYTIEKISPTKMKGNVYAHAILRFGAVWVRFRIVKSEHGLFVTPPANPCNGSGGRKFYKRSAGVDDEATRDKLSEDILAALEKHLANEGRNMPKPLPPKPKRPNRIREALAIVAEHADPEEAARLLTANVNEVLGDPNATVRETLSACRLVAKIIELGNEQLDALTARSRVLAQA